MNKRNDTLESVSEELILMGFDSKVDNHEIIVNTIAGQISTSVSEKTVMGNVYRIISHIGIKIHSWGLKLKIEENK